MFYSLINVFTRFTGNHLQWGPVLVKLLPRLEFHLKRTPFQVFSLHLMKIFGRLFYRTSINCHCMIYSGSLRIQSECAKHQNNSEYGHFLRSVLLLSIQIFFRVLSILKQGFLLLGLLSCHSLEYENRKSTKISEVTIVKNWYKFKPCYDNNPMTPSYY